MQAETKVNDMRASRTLNILEADAVAEAESNNILIVNARLIFTSGVCVVGMYEKTQSRNLGGPIHSDKVKLFETVSKNSLKMNRKSDGFIVSGK